MVYETERLIVGLWTDEEVDVSRVLDMCSRWEVARWLGARPRAMADRSEAFTAVGRWAKLSADDPRSGAWAVQVRETGVAAGTVLVKPLPNTRR